MAKKKNFDGIMVESFNKGYRSEQASTSLTREQFAVLARMASAMDIRDEYIHWVSGFDPALLGYIWDITRCSVRDIRKHIGITQAEFANRFLVAKRTVEDWETNKRAIPLHLKLLLAEVTGYLLIELK